MLTLITDASYDGPGCAGWAAWAKADGMEQYLTGGVIDASVTSAGEAELAACVYGLRAALEYAPGHDVLLQSDSMHALRILRDRLALRESPHKQGSRIQGKCRLVTVMEGVLCSRFRDAATGGRVGVLVRHVKGHVPGGKGRHWVNAQCDEVAKKYMRQARGASVGVV